MAGIDEITKAIGAHGLWKHLLRQAIDSGTSEFTIDTVKPDTVCDFGKWLYAIASSDGQSPHWKTVQELHAQFHIEAASVLDLALKGQKQRAENAMEIGSRFAKVSGSLMAAMVKWRIAL